VTREELLVGLSEAIQEAERIERDLGSIFGDLAQIKAGIDEASTGLADLSELIGSLRADLKREANP
jgi:hypothetical protein